MALGSKRADRIARIRRTAHQQSVARSAAQEANIRTRKIGAPGSLDRRVLHQERIGAYEVYLHATKGWRRRRVPLAAGDEARPRRPSAGDPRRKRIAWVSGP